MNNPLHQGVFSILAERAGFEPAAHLSACNRLAGDRFQPLSHLSKLSAIHIVRENELLSRGLHFISYFGSYFNHPEIVYSQQQQPAVISFNKELVAAEKALRIFTD